MSGRLQRRLERRLLSRVKLSLDLVDVGLKLLVGRSELLLRTNEPAVILQSRVAATQQVQRRAERWLPDRADCAGDSILTEPSRLHVRKLGLDIASDKPEPQANEHGYVSHSFVSQTVPNDRRRVRPDATMYRPFGWLGRQDAPCVSTRSQISSYRPPPAWKL